VPLDEQSGKGLSDVLDAVIKKTTEEFGHKFNKQQSIQFGMMFFVLLAFFATFFQ
jgi:hypothetical protein